MKELAIWMGYIEGMNYTGKMAYFKRIKYTKMVLVSHINEYHPGRNVKQFTPLMERLIKIGARITVEKVWNRTSQYINVEAVVEIDHKIITAMGMTYQGAIVNAVVKYVKSINQIN